MGLRHKFVDTIPDGADATVVRPSNWNDDHAMTSAAVGDVLVVDTDGATVTRLPAGTANNLLKTNGAGSLPSWAAAVNSLNGLTGALSIAVGASFGMSLAAAGTTVTLGATTDNLQFRSLGLGRTAGVQGSIYAQLGTNGGIAHYCARFTDTSPSGWFQYYVNAAANAVLWSLDVNGNATAAGWIQATNNLYAYQASNQTLGYLYLGSAATSYVGFNGNDTVYNSPRFHQFNQSVVGSLNLVAGGNLYARGNSVYMGSLDQVRWFYDGTYLRSDNPIYVGNAFIANGNGNFGNASTSSYLSINGSSSGASGGSYLQINNNKLWLIGNYSVIGGGGYNDDLAIWTNAGGGFAIRVNAGNGNITFGNGFYSAAAGQGNYLLGTAGIVGANGTMQIAGTTGSHVALSLMMNGTGNTQWETFFDSNGSQLGAISMVSGAVQITQGSDQRIKTNIVDYDLSKAGPLLDLLRVREFDRIDTGHHQVGLITQEVEPNFPDMVIKGSPPEMNYGDPGFIPEGLATAQLQYIMLAEIKALRERVATLERQVKMLLLQQGGPVPL